MTARQRSYRDGEPSLGRYELRPANTVAACAEIPVDRARLITMMKDHRFGLDELPTQYEAGSVNRALSELSLPDVVAVGQPPRDESEASARHSSSRGSTCARAGSSRA